MFNLVRLASFYRPLVATRGLGQITTKDIANTDTIVLHLTKTGSS